MGLSIYKSEILKYKLRRSCFFKVKFKRFFILKNKFYTTFIHKYLQRRSFLKWNITGKLIYKEFSVFNFLWTQNRINYFKRLKKLSSLSYKKGYRFDLYSKLNFGKFLNDYSNKTKNIKLINFSTYTNVILKKKNKLNNNRARF